MTATLDLTRRHEALSAKLAALRAERDQAQAEIAPQAKGDDADRATNVDAHVRLAILDERIAVIESELAFGNRPKDPAAADIVAVGDLVSVDFGDGPEQFLLASVEESAGDVEVITPGSPLGQALVGAHVDADIAYRTAGRSLSVKVIAIG